MFEQRDCKSVEICCLLDKPEGREVKLEADYKCFTIPKEFIVGFGLDYKENGINLQAILESAGNGILVTGFNGGNCNSTTGNFSYGIEGFAFRDGKITHPVREMLITGNMVSLWQSIMAAGSDAREGARWQIPSLAFGDVDFTGE